MLPCHLFSVLCALLIPAALAMLSTKSLLFMPLAPPCFDDWII
jgi:hypothetical protein